MTGGSDERLGVRKLALFCSYPTCARPLGTEFNVAVSLEAIETTATIPEAARRLQHTNQLTRPSSTVMCFSNRKSFLPLVAGNTPVDGYQVFGGWCM